MVTSVLSRLRDGVPSEELRSPFDRRSFCTYLIVAAELLAAAVLLPVFGFSLTRSAAVALPLWAFLLCAAAILLRRYGHVRFCTGMEATALIYGQGFAILFLLFPLTAISCPLADSRLASIDHALGFDWPGFARIFVGHDGAQQVLSFAYHSFNWQPVLIVVALCSINQVARCWQFVAAGTIAAAVTSMLYPFAPALGSFAYFHARAADFPALRAGGEFGSVIQSIKAGTRTISPKLFQGLISFPSYHAASAVIFAWAMWPFRRMRLVFLSLNIVMCVAALVLGEHYLIDVIAGAAVGAVSVLAAKLLIREVSPVNVWLREDHSQAQRSDRWPLAEGSLPN